MDTLYDHSSKSSGYFKYKDSVSAPKEAKEMPVARVKFTGSPRPKDRNATLQTY